MFSNQIINFLEILGVAVKQNLENAASCVFQPANISYECHKVPESSVKGFLVFFHQKEDKKRRKYTKKGGNKGSIPAFRCYYIFPWSRPEFGSLLAFRTST